jgi:hypothetical protein
VALVFAEGLTPEQESFLDEHTFLHLENGIDVTFLGPYSDMDGLVIGS